MLPARRSRQMFSNVLRHGEPPISAGLEYSALLIRGNLRMIELRAARNLPLKRRRMRLQRTSSTAIIYSRSFAFVTPEVRFAR